MQIASLNVIKMVLARVILSTFPVICIRYFAGILDMLRQLIENGTILEAEVLAQRCALEYCVKHNFLYIIVETYSVALQKILDKLGNPFDPAYGGQKDISDYKDCSRYYGYGTYTERREFPGWFFANHIFSFAGTYRLIVRISKQY